MKFTISKYTIETHGMYWVFLFIGLAMMFTTMQEDFIKGALGVIVIFVSYNMVRNIPLEIEKRKGV